MTKRKKLPKWYEIYPAGTKEGNEESRFFKVLERNLKYQWRGTAAIAAESGLTKTRVEEIIVKYYYDGRNKLGMIFQSPTNEDHWGYWERVPEMVPEEVCSISEQDKEKRIDKAMGCETWVWGIDVGDTNEHSI